MAAGRTWALAAISATLTHPDYNCLILMYDNESYANTDIQLSGSTPWGANTTFSTPGTVKRIMHHRWKKNMAGDDGRRASHVPLRGDHLHVIRPARHELHAQSADHRRADVHPLARSLP